MVPSDKLASRSSVAVQVVLSLKGGGVSTSLEILVARRLNGGDRAGGDNVADGGDDRAGGIDGAGGGCGRYSGSSEFVQNWVEDLDIRNQLISSPLPVPVIPQVLYPYQLISRHSLAWVLTSFSAACL